MKRYFFILIIILLHNYSFSQKWEHIYGYPGTSESFKDIIEFYDKGYLLSGSYEQEHGNWLIKTDINGNMIWEKILKWEDVSVYRTSVVQDDNGNIIAASNTAGGTTGLWPLIVKIDPCGEKIWCRVFPNYDYMFGSYQDVLVLDNNDILALGQFESLENLDQVYLDYIDTNGNLLWRQVYASRNDYPHIRSCSGDEIKKYGNNYLIHGHCYYPYPSDTTHFYLRPLYIMLDSLFNEQWIIPFGVNDSIVGEAFETYQLNESEYMGVGILRLSGNMAHSLITYFNNNGQELGYNVIPNDSIANEISDNFINDIEQINDTLFLASTAIIIDDEIGLWADLIIDSTGIIYNKQFRSEETSGWTKIVKTFDDKYTIGCGWEEGNTKTDIYLYKINEDLEQDTLYPGNYTYDSLCPYQIQSGIIDISDCLIVTDVGEIPSPKEYYSSLKTIPIKVYPNPAIEGQITFEFQNTEYNQNMELRCFNVFGELVHEERIYQYQGRSVVDVSRWNKGMYVAVVYSNGIPSGNIKFIIQ